jgi:uncharacterized OsmC-like protein
MTTPHSDSEAESRVEEANQAVGPLLMRSVARIHVTHGPDKLVRLPTEQQLVPMGMHDELADHYKAMPGSFEPHASTLDYVVGAVGACLTGTFKRSLVARGVTISPGDLESEAIGEIFLDGDVPILRAIEVRYSLSGTREDDQERIQRAHAVHHRACAVSRSVEPAIAVTTVLKLT